MNLFLIKLPDVMHLFFVASLLRCELCMLRDMSCRILQVWSAGGGGGWHGVLRLPPVLRCASSQPAKMVNNDELAATCLPRRFVA